MNLHVLQSEDARAEARILMKVQEQILSPRFGGPIIGGIHDHITGLFLMTYLDTKFTKEEALRLVTYRAAVNVAVNNHDEYVKLLVMKYGIDPDAYTIDYINGRLTPKEE